MEKKSANTFCSASRPTLTLGISPCPNDTFVFDAWVNGRLGEKAPGVSCRIADIDTLNNMAAAGELDIVKVSVYAYGRLQGAYELLSAGGAMGQGCGPLIVARRPDLDQRALGAQGIRVAVPGRWTTAHCLLSLYQPAATQKIFMPFDRILPAVADGEVDAGVIIHEGRFIYRAYGLVMVEDLGAWWETTTGYPVPLGAIIAKKSLGHETITVIEATIRASLQAARDNPEAPLPFMRKHADTMDAAVMQQHVQLYVNEYTYDFGKEGMQAIAYLLQRAREQGLYNTL